MTETAVAQRRQSVLWLSVGLALGPLTALGLGRFAYALLLPAMKSDLHWSFAGAGAVNAANAVGYLAGSMVAARLAAQLGSRRSFLVSIAVTGVSLAACGVVSGYVPLLVLRAVTGFSGAVTFVTGAGLLAQAARVRGAGTTLATGLYFAGASMGITATGLGVPALLAVLDADTGWRAAWLLMGGLAFVVLAVAVLPARRTVEPPPPPTGGDHRWPARRLAASLVAYGMFGAGYIAYMTFVVVYLQDAGATATGISAFWCVLGVAGMAGPFLWSRVLPRLPKNGRPAVLLVVLAVGAGLPLVSYGAVAGFVSAAMFGGSFLMLVAVYTENVKTELPSHQWTPAIGGLTVAFATGQFVGPVLAGLLADSSGGVRLGLGVSAAVLVAGAVVALLQRPLLR